MTVDGYERYAVRWIPPLSESLAQFGVAWTGWCAETGAQHRRIATPVDGLSLEPLTRETARHGFHGVLRPSFRLNDPRRIWSLERALADAAEAVPELSLEPLQIGIADGRVALFPSEQTPALSELAWRIGGAVAPFALNGETPEEPDRADVATAAAMGVTLRSAAHFYMPLTDRLPIESACQLALRLAGVVRPVLGLRHVVSDVCLIGDPGIGRRARVLQRFALGEGSMASHPFACRGPRLLTPLTFESFRGVPA